MRIGLSRVPLASFAALAFIAIAPPNFSAAAEPITGTAEVTDGDSLKVNGCNIRLEGIDAPEKDQFCINAGGQQVACGFDARDRLRDFINGRQVSCEKKGVDIKYCRTLAACSVDGEDIQAWMVSEGLALAYEEYSKEFVPQQDEARAAQRGLWRGTFVAPWEFRHHNQQARVLGVVPPSTDDQNQLRTRLLAPISSAGAPSLACIIKGNVNQKGGKIYHMPGTYFYSQTRMRNPGVQWFCTEKDAVEAGWQGVAEFKLDCDKRMKPHCR